MYQLRFVSNEKRVENVPPVGQASPETSSTDGGVFEKRPDGYELIVLVTDNERDRKDLRPGVLEPDEHPFCGEERVGGFGLIE